MEGSLGLPPGAKVVVTRAAQGLTSVAHHKQPHLSVARFRNLLRRVCHVAAGRARSIGVSGIVRRACLARNRPASRRRLRTWPKLRRGSSLCTSPKTSPLASLVGSHHPRPAWLTIRISPLPRRYFRLSFVLSFRSSFQRRRSSLQHHGTKRGRSKGAAFPSRA